MDSHRESRGEGGDCPEADLTHITISRLAKIYLHANQAETGPDQGLRIHDSRAGREFRVVDNPVVYRHLRRSNSERTHRFSLVPLLHSELVSTYTVRRRLLEPSKTC